VIDFRGRCADDVFDRPIRQANRKEDVSTRTAEKVHSTTTTHASSIIDEQVSGWRCEELARAGYSADAAAKIAERGDIDLHLASNIRRQGCTDELALAILL